MTNKLNIDTAEVVKPGELLRLFVRGFLRDHMGMSKIAAHMMADLFMKRWLARDEATRARYAREDKHTLAATLDRDTIQKADAALGLTEALKADMQKTLSGQPILGPSLHTGNRPLDGLVEDLKNLGFKIQVLNARQL